MKIKDRITTSINQLLSKILNQMKYSIVFLVTHSKIFNTDIAFCFSQIHKVKYSKFCYQSINHKAYILILITLVQ